MADLKIANATMTAVRLERQPVIAAHVLKSIRFLQLQPRFSKAESDKLKADPDGVIASSVDNKQWCSLKKWLNPTPAEKGGVLCRRSGLSIQLDRASLPADVQLLPFGAQSLKARLLYDLDGRSEGKDLETQVDHRENRLKLLLPFEDSPEGRQVFDAIVRALSTPPGAKIQLAYGHAWQEQVPGGRPPVTEIPIDRPPIVRPPTRRPPIVRDHRRKPLRPPSKRLRLGSPDTAELRVRNLAAVTPAAGFAAATTRAEVVRDHRETAVVRDHRENARVIPNFKIARTIDADHLRSIFDIIRKRDPENGGAAPTQTFEDVSLNREFVIPDVFRDQRDETAFPDLLRFNLPGGWGSFTPGGERRLYYKPSPRLDTFLYLPSQFKLGFFLEPDGLTGDFPIRVSQYKDSEGRHRFKVNLTAIPYVDDQDREKLRSYLAETLLSGQLPFVRLEQAGGLKASLVRDFTAGGVGDQLALPSGIQAEVLNVDINDRLNLQFDMAAELYEIFTQLLLRGLRCNVFVNLDDFQETIPVRLDLTDVATNAVRVEAPPASSGGGVLLWQEGGQITAEEGQETAVADSAEESEIELVVRNSLPYPVRVASIQAILLDLGAVPGSIWEAENQDLLPKEGAVVQPGGATEHDELGLTVSQKKVAVWDETLVQVGRLQVEGGSPEDWLRRVHQDASLTPAEFALRIEALAPQAGGQIDLLRLRILKAGEGAVRQSQEMRPSSELTWSLQMTLDELAGLSGEKPRFLLEYDCVHSDGKVSLPQRKRIELGGSRLLLRPLVETPQSKYTVIFAEPDKPEQTREGLTRAEADELLRSLAGQGAEWSVFSSEGQGPGTGEPDHEPDGEDTRPEPVGGTEIKLIADLLNFDSGLLNVFVTVQPDQDGAPQTTFVFSADQPGSQNWKAPSSSIPPFRYKITYVFQDGPAKQKQGVETNPVLVLDPAAA